jgi:hypothetical protein
VEKEMAIKPLRLTPLFFNSSSLSLFSPSFPLNFYHQPVLCNALATMDLVASYLQQQKKHQQGFLRSAGEINDNDAADSIVSAAVSSMASGARRALQKSRRRAEQNVEGARAVT